VTDDVAVLDAHVSELYVYKTKKHQQSIIVFQVHWVSLNYAQSIFQKEFVTSIIDDVYRMYLNFCSATGLIKFFSSSTLNQPITFCPSAKGNNVSSAMQNGVYRMSLIFLLTHQQH
jgi:hypothetical protein